MKKLLRYLVNTILFVAIWCIPATLFVGWSFSVNGTRPSGLIAIGGIVAIFISYKLVKRINKSKLWANLFDEVETVSDVVEEKKVEVKEEKINISKKAKTNIEQDSFSQKIGYSIGRLIMLSVKNFLLIFLLIGIIYIINPNNYFSNYYSTINLFNTYSTDELVFIDNNYYSKKDMKIIETGGFVSWGRYFRINDGKRHGKWVYYDKFINYKKGIVEGLCKKYHPNYSDEEQVMEEINFKEGKFHGLARSWHKNGQLESEILFKEGKLAKIRGIWDKEANLLDFENLIDFSLNKNKLYLADDWIYLKENVLSDALIYAQKKYPSNYYASKWVREYLSKNNFISDHRPIHNEQINHFFGWTNWEYSYSEKARRELNIPVIYDGDINKLIDYSRTPAGIRKIRIIEDNISYILLLNKK